MSWDFWIEADLGAGPVNLDILDANYTYNVSGMLKEALGTEHGIRDLDGVECSVAAPILRRGIDAMVADPARFEAMDPPNGWGSHHGALELLIKIAEACARAPRATLRIV